MRVATLVTGALNGAADLDVTTSPQALPDLLSGPTGILVRAHPDNDSSSRIRVASNAAAATGCPLAPGESFTFPVRNANQLKAVLEAAVNGAAKLCFTPA